MPLALCALPALPVNFSAAARQQVSAGEDYLARMHGLWAVWLKTQAGMELEWNEGGG